MHTGFIMLAQATQNSGSVPGTGPWLVWGIVLLAAALALFFIEAFVPTGGVLGLVSGGCAVAGLVFFFRVDTTLGLAAAACSLIALPFFIAFALKVWPDTPFAKWITIGETRESRQPDGPTMHETADGLGVDPGGNPRPAVGDFGKAVTVLRPVGTCSFDGRRAECMARGGRIDAGRSVRVVAVEGSEVYVQATEER